MGRHIAEWTATGLAGAGVTLIVLAAWLERFGSGRFCPGPRLGILGWLRRPWRLLVGGGCGYDLRGVHGVTGEIGCPECGRGLPSLARAARWRGARRVRQAGTWLVLLGGMAMQAPYVRSGRWAAYLPTTALIAWEQLRFSWRPERCCWELEARVGEHRLSGWQARWLASAMVRDLGDDEYRGNAGRAMMILQGLQELADPALGRALLSSDWQQRQLAASLLRERTADNPSDDLLRVTVEGLRDDSLPYQAAKPGSQFGADTCVFNAREGVEFLLAHADRAEPFLEAALLGDDPQARRLAARIAGMTGMQSLASLAMPILFDELKDRQGAESLAYIDAAIFGFGLQAVPWLLVEQSLTSGEQRDHCLVVLRNFGLLPATEQRGVGRLPLLPLRRLVALDSWFFAEIERSNFCGISMQDVLIRRHAERVATAAKLGLTEEDLEVVAEALIQ